MWVSYLLEAILSIGIFLGSTFLLYMLGSVIRHAYRDIRGKD